MTDAARVQRWFEAGLLRRPEPTRPSTISLSRALAALCGANTELDEPAALVKAAIGPADHYIFVLADGLGMNLIEGQSSNGFLRQHLAMEMSSAFPSSTAPGLTSLATGVWPAEHGLLGWFVYLPDRGLHTIALPFRERFTHRSLDELDLSGNDLFDWHSLLPLYQRNVRLLMPRAIAESAYTRATSGGVPVDPYGSLEEAMDLLVLLINESQAATYTYFYYSRIDSVAHTRGPFSPATRDEVTALDDALESLDKRLSGRARIVVSADHGGIDLDDSTKLILNPHDPVAGLLETPPSGEPRTPFFHVKPGMVEEFVVEFRAQFGERFALLSAAEVEQMTLLGPGALSATAAVRLGDFMAISAGGEALVYAPDHGYAEMIGFHGGLDPREVRVPLVVA